MKFRATAEHCNGKSVGHPCKEGVYDDPTERLNETVEAESYEECERQARGFLNLMVVGSAHCECHKSRTLGNDAWWDSVVITLAPLDLAAHAHAHAVAAAEAEAQS